MVGTYLSPATPSLTPEFIVRAESSIFMGTQRLYGSLDVTNWTYATYEASIGLQDANSFQLGTVADLSWSHKPEYEAMESFNISDDSIWEITGEESLLTVELQQLDARLFEVAVGTGVMYYLGVERLLTFGGGCQLRRRPFAVEFINDSCNAPTSQDVASGITGGCLTLYDCFVQSGLEWNMAAKESNTIPLELQALPVLERARGNRLGSLYLY